MFDTKVQIEQAENRALALMRSIDDRTDDQVVHLADSPSVRHSVRDMLTLALYALAITDNRAVPEVELDALAAAVQDRQRWRSQVQAALIAAGHNLTYPELTSATDPVTARFARLYRVGERGHSELDLWLVDAADVADQVLAAKRQGLGIGAVRRPR